MPPQQPMPIQPPALTQTAFDALEALKVAPPASQSTSTQTTIQQITTRAAAEQQSAEAVQAYDDKVNDLLKKNGVATGVCPMAFR